MIELRYGLGDEGPMTLEDIGHAGRSHPRARAPDRVEDAGDAEELRRRRPPRGHGRRGLTAAASLRPQHELVFVSWEAGLPKYAKRICKTHGLTDFVLEGRGYYRCKACRMQRVMDWRRRAKLRLIAEAGGCCRICGYDRYSGALHFHHRDPSQKEFGLAKRGFTRSYEKMRAEAAKCVLLCSNCHAEVEAGVATLPAAA